MAVSEQIQDELRRGRTPEEVLELLKSKGLSEANARRFLERGQAAVASDPVPRATSERTPTSGVPRRPASAAAPRDDADPGGGSVSMAVGAFFFVLGVLGTALTYVMAKPGGKFLLLYGAIAWGLVAFVRGFARWSRVRDSHPFPALPVGGAIMLPALIMAGIYVKAAWDESQRRERVAQMVREEQQRRGIEAGGKDAPPDPVSAYIVVLKNAAKDADSRREAAWRLGEMRQGARDAVPALQAALRDQSGDVRRSAAEALIKIDGQNPEVVTAIKGLFADSSSQVWAPLIRQFAQTGDPDARKALLAKLEDPQLWSREAACGILADVRDDPGFAAPLIVGKLKSDPEWQVRVGCARALGHLGSATPEVKAALAGAAAADLHPYVKKAAAEALAKLAPAGP